MMSFTFPVGYHALHPVKIIEFQLNRWHSFGYIPLDEVQEAGRRIRSFGDWKGVMTGLAEQAAREERWIPAAFLFRAAEFFIPPSDPDKEELYDRFIDLAYAKAFAGEPVERHSVPYAKTHLPALRVPAGRTPAKGTIVIHGGFDSFIEEFYAVAAYFARSGCDVVMFEGPGQGAALRKNGLPLTHEWEKPVKAVLDHFRLEDVTLLGFSMGGWLCLRAAASEPRVSRVIASSIVYDYMQIPPLPVQWLARLLFRFPRLTDRLAVLKMKADYQERWGIDNLMYITKNPSPAGASEVLLRFNAANLRSDRVKQDVLILTGAEDHFIPLKLHHRQVNALTNARSVTARIFTREEQGQNHCQIGNIGLALDVMREWIDMKA